MEEQPIQNPQKIQDYSSPKAGYGCAIDYVCIDPDGTMWVGNGEYGSQVNFNPWTGEPAPKQMQIIKQTDTQIDYGNTL